MRCIQSFFLSCVFMALLTATPAPAQPAKSVRLSPPVTLSPHRAVYEITLADTTNASGISGLRGRLVFEVAGSSCDGYTINMRFVTQMTDQNGAVNVSDLRTSSWESGEGKRFRFSSSEYNNSRLKTITSGDAVRSQNGKSINIRLKRPKVRNVNIPQTVMFPTQHSIRLIQSAIRGETVMQADLYDGSEQGAKVFATTAIIGNVRKAGDQGLNNIKNADILNKINSWPVSIGYFDKDTQQNLPSYQFAFRIFENGVSRKLHIDYGSFSIKGELKKIDFFAPGKCQ